MVKKLISAGMIAGIPLLGWAVFENTALLGVSAYTPALKALPRTVLFSDLHKRRFGRGNHRLISKIANLQPELICIAGDIVSRTETNFSAVRQLLGELTGLAPVIISAGNHETDLPPTLYAELRRIIAQSGAVYLDNAIQEIEGVPFAGLTLPRSYYRGGGFLGFSGARTCTPGTMHRVLGKCPAGTVLLAHDPLFFPAYAEWGAALVLSGHVHGGAVRLPGVGGLLSPERKFFPPYDKGLYRIGDSEMVVSAGLGKLRLFDPPEVVLIGAIQ